METQTEATQSSIKQKPGPKAKPKIEPQALLDRIEALERIIIRMAHNSGTSHSILIKNGLEPYSPTKGDMGKYKN